MPRRGAGAGVDGAIVMGCVALGAVEPAGAGEVRVRWQDSTASATPKQARSEAA
jgi:hypothetical protein